MDTSETYVKMWTKAGFLFVPTQDRLQKMVKNSDDDSYTLIKRFKNFFVELNWHSTASMEQLWLAFVMKEKYNKVWNGEEWIKESSNG